MAAVDSTTRVLILVQGAEAEALFLNFVDTVCPGEGVVIRCSLTYSLEYLKKNEVPPYLIIDIAGDAEDGEYVLPDDFKEKMDKKFGANTYSMRCTKYGGDYYLSEIRFRFGLNFKPTTKGKSQIHELKYILS